MEKVITSALLTIAAVIVSIVFINAVTPMIQSSSTGMAESGARIEERMRTEIKVVTVAGTSSPQPTISVWLKNTGSMDIENIQAMDLLVRSAETVKHYTYGAGTDRWSYEILSGSSSGWVSTGTVRIDIVVSALPTGNQTLTLMTANGISVDYTFRLG